jgi:citrate synthase
MAETQKSTAETGLEGIAAVVSEISSIENGQLRYRGINIDDLAANSTFEETTFLLWTGRLPKADELAKLRADLAANAALSPELTAQIRLYGKKATPMHALRTAVSAASLYDPDADAPVTDTAANARKALRLTAQTGQMVTTFHRFRQGLEPVAPKPEYSVAQNFLYTLTGKEPTETAVKAFDQALVLHADHELPASTFTARCVASTLSDMHSAVTAAIAALKGPLHGGANEQVMIMLEKIGPAENAGPFIKNALANKEKVMGFGHRVYSKMPGGDPRAKWLRKMSEQLGKQTGNMKWYDMSVTIHDIMVEESRAKGKDLLPNVDFYSASVYTYLDIPRDLFTPIFAVSRMAGWTAQIIEQWAGNRLIRPRAEYRGVESAEYVPMAKR